MSICGKIKEFKIITLKQDLDAITPDDRGCKNYVKIKHETAQKSNRYVVEFHIIEKSGILGTHLSTVCVFIPKGIIDNNLIDKNSTIQCGSSSCHLKILGIEDWFDRAYNGATQIHDIRFKKEIF